MLSDIKNAKIGISNLAETYSDDLIIVSEFETILQNIDFTLDDLLQEEHISLPIKIQQISPLQTAASTPDKKNECEDY